MSAFKTITSDNVTVGTTLSFPNRITINNVPQGGATQVLITNALGNPVYGNILPSNISNSTNEQSLWSITGTPTWVNRSIRFGLLFARFNSQNWNSASTTALTFAGTTTANQTFGPTTFSGFTVGASILTCNTTAYYLFNMFGCLTNGGIGTSSIRFNILINGSVVNPGPCIQLGIGETGTISCSFPIAITAGQTVAFQTTRLTGTDSLTVDNNNNSFSLSLLSTLA